VLFGDDGFGPALIAQLRERPDIPAGVLIEDVGTGVRDLLFDILLSDERPGMIIVADAASKPDRRPGEVFELPVAEIQEDKSNDFSVHHFPSINLLRELAECGGVKVKVLAVQVARIPEDVMLGLSNEVEAALPEACDRIVHMLREIQTNKSLIADYNG
jgi:coenzyme F420 hydrogenase subunit delta